MSKFIGIIFFFDCEAKWPGDYSADVPPDTIPNSNVKLCCADGTASKGVGE